MNDPTLIADLVRANVDPELVQRVALELARAQAERQALEKRRAADRARKARGRHGRFHDSHGTSRAVAGQDGTGRGRPSPPDVPPSSPHTPHQPPCNPPSPNPEAAVRGAGSGRAGDDPPRRDPRGTFLPAGWSPDGPDRAYAVARLGEAGAGLELEKFRDYWAARPGEGGRKRDWGATWRTWIRKADDDGRRPPNLFPARFAGRQPGGPAGAAARPSGVGAVLAALADRQARRSEPVGRGHDEGRPAGPDDPGIVDAHWTDARGH